MYTTEYAGTSWTLFEKVWHEPDTPEQRALTARCVEELVDPKRSMELAGVSEDAHVTYLLTQHARLLNVLWTQKHLDEENAIEARFVHTAYVLWLQGLLPGNVYISDSYEVAYIQNGKISPDSQTMRYVHDWLCDFYSLRGAGPLRRAPCNTLTPVEVSVAAVLAAGEDA